MKDSKKYSDYDEDYCDCRERIYEREERDEEYSNYPREYYEDYEESVKIPKKTPKKTNTPLKTLMKTLMKNISKAQIFNNYKNIETIEVDGCEYNFDSEKECSQIRESFLKFIQESENLVKLNVINVPFEQEHLLAVSKLSNLESLDIMIVPLDERVQY